MSITVTCKRERSRRRCDHEFTREPQTFPDDHFSDEEVERLQADPVLKVEFVDEGPKVPGKSASHADLDAFAEEHKEEYFILARFIGKDAKDGWSRPLKLRAIEEALNPPEQTEPEQTEPEQTEAEQEKQEEIPRD